MTSRTRSRRGRRGAAIAAPPVAAAPTVEWVDLSGTEQTALKRLNRGPYPGLSEETARRLIDLGLAVARPDRVGISRHGRELVISMLLEGRQKD